jgi:hypothetical protein
MEDTADKKRQSEAINKVRYFRFMTSPERKMIQVS